VPKQQQSAVASLSDGLGGIFCAVSWTFARAPNAMTRKGKNSISGCGAGLPPHSRVFARFDGAEQGRDDLPERPEAVDLAGGREAVPVDAGGLRTEAPG
jgi:hypothetical protein